MSTCTASLLLLQQRRFPTPDVRILRHKEMLGLSTHPRPASMPPRLRPLPAPQSTPLAQPAASAEFVPEDLEYRKGVALGAAWPALIGLGVAAAALLLFLLW